MATNSDWFSIKGPAPIARGLLPMSSKRTSHDITSVGASWRRRLMSFERCLESLSRH
jgi:hypothetical protein